MDVMLKIVWMKFTNQSNLSLDTSIYYLNCLIYVKFIRWGSPCDSIKSSRTDLADAVVRFFANLKSSFGSRHKMRNSNHVDCGNVSMLQMHLYLNNRLHFMKYKITKIPHSKFYLYIQKQKKIKFLTLYTDINIQCLYTYYIICTQEKYT